MLEVVCNEAGECELEKIDPAKSSQVGSGGVGGTYSQHYPIWYPPPNSKKTQAKKGTKWKWQEKGWKRENYQSYQEEAGW